MVEAARPFVRVHVNGDKAEREGDAEVLAAIRRYGIEVYPTVVFTDHAGTEVARSTRNRPALLEAIGAALKECGPGAKAAAADKAEVGGKTAASEPADPRLREALRRDAAYRTDPGSLEKTERLFLRHCATCHGAAGNGIELGIAPVQGMKPKDFTDPKAMEGMTDERMLRSIRDGYRLMPGFGWTMPESRIKELVAYIRTLAPKGPEAPPASSSPPPGH